MVYINKPRSLQRMDHCRTITGAVLASHDIDEQEVLVDIMAVASKLDPIEALVLSDLLNVLDMRLRSRVIRLIDGLLAVEPERIPDLLFLLEKKLPPPKSK